MAWKIRDFLLNSLGLQYTRKAALFNFSEKNGLFDRERHWIIIKLKSKVFFIHLYIFYIYMLIYFFHSFAYVSLRKFYYFIIKFFLFSFIAWNMRVYDSFERKNLFSKFSPPDNHAHTHGIIQDYHQLSRSRCLVFKHSK